MQSRVIILVFCCRLIMIHICTKCYLDISKVFKVTTRTQFKRKIYYFKLQRVKHPTSGNPDLRLLSTARRLMLVFFM